MSRGSWDRPEELVWSSNRVGESERDAEADWSDFEHSLGWTATINQAGRNWHGDLNGGEQEHDGREPDVDAEEDDPPEDGGDDEPDSDMEPRWCGLTVDARDALCLDQAVAPTAKKTRRRQAAPGLSSRLRSSEHAASLFDGPAMALAWSRKFGVVDEFAFRPDENRLGPATSWASSTAAAVCRLGNIRAA